MPTSADLDRQRKAEDLAALEASPKECKRAVALKPQPLKPVIGAKKGEKFATSEEVEKFDILGVQLYTPLRDALAAARLSVLKNDLSLELTACVLDQIERDKLWRLRYEGGSPKSPEEKKACVKALRLSDGKVRMDIELVEDIPAQPGCMVVSRIRLDQDGRNNEASIQTWEHALVEKYGNPRPYTHIWGEYGDARLEASDYYSSFALKLSNQAFTDDRNGAFSKAVADAKPGARPKF